MGTKAEEPQVVPLPTISKEKRFIDAQFREKKQQKKPKQQKKSNDKWTGEKTKVKAEDDGDDINLDDIAKALGAK